MSFLAPSLLSALLLLPLLWWLLRLTPPPPREVRFPALRFLAGLTAPERSKARTPLWLLFLRLLIAALVILGLAGPVREQKGVLPGEGPLLLVIDDGWAAARDWPRRLEAIEGVLDEATRRGREVAFLTTAPAADGHAPQPSPSMPPAEALSELRTLLPKPWPADHGAAAKALTAGQGRFGGTVFLGDGLAAPGEDEFQAALAALHPLLVLDDPSPPLLLRDPALTPAGLGAAIEKPPAAPAPPEVTVLAATRDGRVLGRGLARFAPGEREARVEIPLPNEIRNQIARLSLAGTASAGSVLLLDERWRRRVVGLAAANVEAAETPFLGALYYLHRALAPYAELREGPLESLLDQKLSLLVLADRPLTPGPESEKIGRFVEEGGILVRFAGPLLAAHGDSYLPVRLLEGDRALGGALSWEQAVGLAPFPAASPFAGLSIPSDVRVRREVLADPESLAPGAVWATLADGTPLVTAAPRGRGWIVFFHVTANAEWSNLPLSGLFVDMFRRLLTLAAGLAPHPETEPVSLAAALDGFGLLGPPNPAARPLAPARFATTPPSPAAPPGLWGPESHRTARNLADGLPALAEAPSPPGAVHRPLGAARPLQTFGPDLLAAAFVLFLLDLLISLAVRGLWRRAPALAALACGALLSSAVLTQARAQSPPEPHPALETRLAFVLTGDPELDRISAEGLTGLSDFVNAHTAAELGTPAGVRPGDDDLSFYPLLYWPLDPAQTLPSGPALDALNTYMRHGGILLIDTRSAGVGETLNGDEGRVLRTLGAHLDVPPLTPLTVDHVLAHSFFLLRDFPGRYDGGTVWVARGPDRANDDVSPIIIGANDWAAAWAVDESGRHPFAVIPGGERQRLLAYRFGVNLVMYALTGNYKGDQVHVPAILERLGQ
jgi:hypothetical protein